MSQITDMLAQKMGKTKIVLKEGLNTVRAGRANPAGQDCC